MDKERKIAFYTLVKDMWANNADGLEGLIPFYEKNRHKAQRKAKFYINKCRSASCMQSGWKRTPA